MRKLLLVGINCRYTHSNLALRYLRNHWQNQQDQVDLLEFSINQSEREILQAIYQQQPDLLAFSVYIWNAELIQHLLPDLKKILPAVKIILGGPEVSFDFQRWLRDFPEIDQIICGNGEAANPLKSSELQQLIKADNLPFSSVAFPYSSQDFPQLEHKYIYYESSRGCPFRCSYCLSSRRDQVLDFRDLKQVLAELQWLAKFQPRIIKFVDRTFNARPSHHRPIWQFLIAEAGVTKYHFELHPEFLTEEDFEILATAPQDLFQFEIGIQSTNPRTIAAIDRQDNWQKSRANISRLQQMGKFHLHTDLIVGLPHEDLASLARSFDEIISLAAQHFQMGFLKVLPGTKMAEQVEEYEIMHTAAPPYEILSNRWLDFQQINQLKVVEQLLDKFYGSQKFQFTIGYCQQLWQSPFRFYWQFAEWILQQEQDLRIKDWSKNCGSLLEFLLENHPSKRELFIDLLRYDWCNNFRGKFPAIIDSAANRARQKRAQEYLKSYNQSGIIKIGEQEFSMKELKNANYFQAESKEFCTLLNQKPEEIVMFLQQKPFFIWQE
ncbi:MAG: DUF4080 domain-containing protein [Candidatus Cloacimonadales bacterium]